MSRGAVSEPSAFVEVQGGPSELNEPGTATCARKGHPQTYSDEVSRRGTSSHAR
jgi:hypothetical protein